MRLLFALLFASTLAFAQKTGRVAVEIPTFTGPSEFDSFLDNEKVIQTSAEDFVAKNSRFEFTSGDKKDSARVDGKRYPKSLAPTFQSIPLVESVVRFDKAGNELTFIIFSIGDLGPINEDKFNETVDTLTKALTKSYGNPSAPVAAASVMVDLCRSEKEATIASSERRASSSCCGFETTR